MATLKLPVGQAAPWFSLQTTLSGVRYGVEMQFNSRAKRWFLSLSDQVGQPIVTGIPLLPGRALTEQYRTRAVPPGVLYVNDSTGQSAPPGLDSFSTTHDLLYEEPAG